MAIDHPPPPPPHPPPVMNPWSAFFLASHREDISLTTAAATSSAATSSATTSSCTTAGGRARTAAASCGNCSRTCARSTVALAAGNVTHAARVAGVEVGVDAGVSHIWTVNGDHDGIAPDHRHGVRGLDVTVPRRHGRIAAATALFFSAADSFVVVMTQAPLLDLAQHLAFTLCSDGVVCGNMRIPLWIGRDIRAVVQIVGGIAGARGRADCEKPVV